MGSGRSKDSMSPGAGGRTERVQVGQGERQAEGSPVLGHVRPMGKMT